MVDISLRCSCGDVQGLVINSGMNSGLRFVCHCEDCKSFAHYLNRKDAILDKLGGTEIYQVASYNIKISKGAELLRCAMLRKKGLFRWFTQCCNTPIGTTMSDKVAFCGINHCFIDNLNNANELIGSVKGTLFNGNADSSKRRNLFSSTLMARMLLKNIVWKIKRLKKRSPFFDSKGHSVVKPLIIN